MRATQGLSGRGLLMLLAVTVVGCSLFQDDAADLSRVEAFDAPVVRGSVGSRLESTYPFGKKVHLLTHEDGDLRIEISSVVNDYRHSNVEVSLRLRNLGDRDLRLSLPTVRLGYLEEDYPAQDISFLDPDPEPVVRAKTARLLTWRFRIGSWIEAGVYPLNLGLVQRLDGRAWRPAQGTFRFRLEVPGEKIPLLPIELDGLDLELESGAGSGAIDSSQDSFAR